VTALRTASRSARALAGLLLGLLLALRLLGPAGFMPAFEQGAVMIVVCPDAEPIAPTMAGHHHGGHSKKLHQPCPYASASALGSLAGEWPLALLITMLGLVLLTGRESLNLVPRRNHEWPPLRGPPLLA
jgi:hypothetical protein